MGEGIVRDLVEKRDVVGLFGDDFVVRGFPGGIM
jgi:hypothetical protein